MASNYDVHSPPTVDSCRLLVIYHYVSRLDVYGTVFFYSDTTSGVATAYPTGEIEILVGISTFNLSLSVLCFVDQCLSYPLVFF